MIKAFSFSIVIFSMLFLNSFVADTNCFAISYLKKAGIKVEGSRLNGDLKNTPIKNILKGLMESDGFECQVTGDLQGTISLTIENLTAEETIQKIMRNRRYDYTMVLVESESSDGKHPAVRELTIYQGDSTVRFAKIPKSVSTVQPEAVKPVLAPAATLTENPSGSNVASEEALEQLDRELKSLMDEMVAEKKMSRQEYDEALKTFSGEDR